MKTIMKLLSASIVALTLAGCMYDNPTTTLPPGQYEHSSKTVDQNGTVQKQDSTTKVYYDENGNKKATVDKKTTTDPKGWFNKSTNETHETIE